MRSDAASPRRPADEAGMTLVELMIAFGLLAIMLAATAGALITFTRTSAENERRVQATTLLNQSQEDLHAINWDHVGLYENELDALDEIGTYVTGEPGTFDGEEIVERPAFGSAGCEWTTFEEALDCGRDPTVPRVVQTVDYEGREFTLYHVVTWIDRSGDGIADVKRLTSVATWELLGREYAERFVSERAPTNIEADDPQRPRLIQFDLEPRSMTLTGDDQLSDDVEVMLRFTDGVLDAELRFYVVDQVVTEEDEEGNEQVVDVVLREEVITGLTKLISDPDDATRTVVFSGTIPAAAGHRFTDGPRPIRGVGVDGTEEYVGKRTLQLDGGLPPTADPGDPDPEEGDEEPTNPDPLYISSRSGPTPTSVTLRNQQGARVFCQDLVLEAKITGLSPQDLSSVTASYAAGNDVHTKTMQPTTEITGSEDTFRLELPAGSDHGFRHGDETYFNINVNRVDGGEVNSIGDTKVRFENASGSSC